MPKDMFLLGWSSLDIENKTIPVDAHVCECGGLLERQRLQPLGVGSFGGGHNVILCLFICEFYTWLCVLLMMTGYEKK